MTDTDLLRDLLQQAAPTHPDVDPTSRTSSVVRRGRTARVRDRALVAVAAVSVVAVAVAIPISVGGGDGPDRAAPATSVVVEPCPASPIKPQDLGEVGVAGVIVAVRSCPVDGAAGEPLPTEPLTDEAAEDFVHDLVGLPSFKLPQYCMVATVAPEPWALQIQDSLGRIAIVGSTMRECSSVHVNGVDHGSADVLAAFLSSRFPVPADLACPTGDRLADGAPTWNGSFDPATAVAGVVCYRVDPMGTQTYEKTEASLTDDQVAVIRNDLAVRLEFTGRQGGCIDTGPQRMLVLEDADGDRAAWVDDRCIGEFAGPGGYWTPGPEADIAIGAALGRLVD